MGVLSGPGTRWELRGLRWEAPALRLVWERLHLLPVRTATGRTRAATQRQLGDRARSNARASSGSPPQGYEGHPKGIGAGYRAKRRFFHSRCVWYSELDWKRQMVVRC